MGRAISNLSLDQTGLKLIITLTSSQKQGDKGTISYHNE